MLFGSVYSFVCPAFLVNLFTNAVIIALNNVPDNTKQPIDCFAISDGLLC